MLAFTKISSVLKIRDDLGFVPRRSLRRVRSNETSCRIECAFVAIGVRIGAFVSIV